MISVKSLKEVKDVVAENDRVILVMTQPATCVPCRRLYPHLVRFAEKHDDPLIVTVDLDTVPDAMVEYDLRSVPTVQLYEDGQYVRTLPQQLTVPKLEQELIN